MDREASGEVEVPEAPAVDRGVVDVEVIFPRVARKRRRRRGGKGSHADARPQRVIEERVVDVNVGFYFGFGWRTYCLNSGPFAGVTALWVIVFALTELLSRKLVEVGGAKPETLGGVYLMWVYETLPVALLVYPGIASIYVLMHRALGDNQFQFEAGRFFSCFTDATLYCRSSAMGFCLYLGTTLGWALAVLPGLAFLLFTIFALPLYLEHPSLGIFGSIRVSGKIMWAHASTLLCTMALFMLINMMFNVWLFWVIWLATLPTGLVAMVLCYHHIVGINGVARDIYFDDRVDAEDAAVLFAGAALPALVVRQQQEIEARIRAENEAAGHAMDGAGGAGAGPDGPSADVKQVSVEIDGRVAGPNSQVDEENEDDIASLYDSSDDGGGDVKTAPVELRAVNRRASMGPGQDSGESTTIGTAGPQMDRPGDLVRQTAARRVARQRDRPGADNT